MFGTKSTTNNDLLIFDWIKEDEKLFVDKIFQICEQKREKALKKMLKKSKENKTYKNVNRVLKEFKLGSLVLQRQLQVSTGKGSDFKPKFTGPYVITKLNTDGSTAIVENLVNGHMSKVHFTNLQLFHFTPKRTPLKSDIEKTLLAVTDTKNSKKEEKTAKRKYNKRKITNSV
jgi:ribosomal protein L21E